MASVAQPDGTFSVVPHTVTDTGQFVKYTAEALVGGIRSVDRDIERLMATWTGDAANVYKDSWEETRDGALQVLDALKKMGEVLGVVVETITTGDSDNATTYSSLDLP